MPVKPFHKFSIATVSCCMLYITIAHAQLKSNNMVISNKHDLDASRKIIDSLDSELIQLLGQREKIVKAIGVYKAKNKIAPLQAARFQEVINKSVALGNKQGLSEQFVTQLMNAVHEESLRIERDSTIVKP
jgi:chorismate mutase